MTTNNPLSKEEREKLKRELEMQGGGQSYYPPQSSGGSSNGGFLKSIIPSIAVLLILGFILLGNVMPKQQTLSDRLTAIDTNVKGISTSFTTLQNSVAQSVNDKVNASTAAFKTSIDNAQAQVTNMANQLSTVTTQLQSMANQVSGYGDLGSKYGTLQQQVSSLSDSIKTLQTTLTQYNTDLTNRVVILENKVTALMATPTPTPTTTTPINKSITVQVKQLSNSFIPASDAKSVSASFRLVLTNNTNADIVDVGIDLQFQSEVIQTVTRSIAISSSPVINWQSLGWFSTQFEFINTWGLTISANSSKTIYVTVTISDTATPATFTSQAYYYDVSPTIN